VFAFQDERIVRIVEDITGLKEWLLMSICMQESSLMAMGNF
jgi:hypothetical protein